METVELFAVTGGGGSQDFCWGCVLCAGPATHIQSFHEFASPSSRICITNLYVLYLYGKCSSIVFFSVLRFFLVDYRNMDVHCMYSLIDAEACSDWLLLCICKQKQAAKPIFRSDTNTPTNTYHGVRLSSYYYPTNPLSNTLLSLACMQCSRPCLLGQFCPLTFFRPPKIFFSPLPQIQQTWRCFL